MTEPKDPKSPSRPSQPTAVGTGSQGSDKRSGRVSHDSRGNPVWEWQLETGVYSRDVSTQRLKKLDFGDLSIAETAKHKKPEGLDPAEKPRMPGGGFNPYDNSSSRDAKVGSNPYDNAKVLGNKVRPAQVAAVPKSPAELRKLEEWMRAKKRAEENKDE
jgi:hypothetical protein